MFTVRRPRSTDVNNVRDTSLQALSLKTDRMTLARLNCSSAASCRLSVHGASEFV
jgi:hypothetical protein